MTPSDLVSSLLIKNSRGTVFWNILTFTSNVHRKNKKILQWTFLQFFFNFLSNCKRVNALALLLICYFSEFLITLQAVNFSCTGCFCSFSKFLARKCAGEWSCKGLSACFPTLIKLQADMLLDWIFLFLIRISVLNICKWAHLDLV